MTGSGRVALVTGASRGIGAAVARTLAVEGADVVLTCVQKREAADRLADEIRALGRRAWVEQFDVRDASQSRAALERILAETPVDILVNNAGVADDNPFPALTADGWHRVIDTALDGFFHITQPLVMPMVRRRWGRIINVASVSGVIGNRGQVNYSASKAGIIGASKALAVEMGKRAITVNCIAPGIIETEMSRDAPLDQVLPAIPMRRLGKPEEVAALAVFLLSEGAAYITRQVISVNGGIV